MIQPSLPPGGARISTYSNMLAGSDCVNIPSLDL